MHPEYHNVILFGAGASFDAGIPLLGSFVDKMTIRIPAKVKHNMVNTGTETLRTMISFSSGDRKTVFLEEVPRK